MEPSSSGFIYETIPAPKAQGILQKIEQKDCKSQGIRECAVRVCLLIMSEATPIKSRQHGCLIMSQTRTTKDMPKQAGKTPQASIRHKNCRPLRDKSVFHREEYSNWLFNTRYSDLKTYIQAIL